MGILDKAKIKELLDDSVTFKIQSTRKIELLKLVKKSKVSMGEMMRLAIERLISDLEAEKK